MQLMGVNSKVPGPSNVRIKVWWSLVPEPMCLSRRTSVWCLARTNHIHQPLSRVPNTRMPLDLIAGPFIPSLIPTPFPFSSLPLRGHMSLVYGVLIR